MTHVIGRDHTVLPATQHEPYLSLLPSIDGTHLLTPEGWKAELTCEAGYIPKWFTRRSQSTIPVLTGPDDEQLR